MKHLSGKWIALDGVDAVGKSTQVQRLKERIEASGLPAMVLPECSESLLGQTIQRIIEERRFYALHALRKTPFADTYALLADTAYKIESEGADILKAGGVALSDRGLLSLVGYQSKRAELYGGMSLSTVVDTLSHVVRSAMEHLSIPDHHVLLTIDEDEMQRRVVGRGETFMEPADLRFMSEVRSIMEQLTADMDTTVLNVMGMSAGEVTDGILRALEMRFAPADQSADAELRTAVE